jgi:hypothetical protein
MDMNIEILRRVRGLLVPDSKTYAGGHAGNGKNRSEKG